MTSRRSDSDTAALPNSGTFQLVLLASPKDQALKMSPDSQSLASSINSSQNSASANDHTTLFIDEAAKYASIVCWGGMVRDYNR